MAQLNRGSEGKLRSARVGVRAAINRVVHMSNEAHYRRQADLCRSEALIRRADPAASAQWLKIAAEYDKLAASAAAMADALPEHQQAG